MIDVLRVFSVVWEIIVLDIVVVVVVLTNDTSRSHIETLVGILPLLRGLVNPVVE